MSNMKARRESGIRIIKFMTKWNDETRPGKQRGDFVYNELATQKNDSTTTLSTGMDYVLLLLLLLMLLLLLWRLLCHPANQK